MLVPKTKIKAGGGWIYAIFGDTPLATGERRIPGGWANGRSGLQGRTEPDCRHFHDKASWEYTEKLEQL